MSCSSNLNCEDDVGDDGNGVFDTREGTSPRQHRVFAPELIAIATEGLVGLSASRNANDHNRQRQEIHKPR